MCVYQSHLTGKIKNCYNKGNNVNYDCNKFCILEGFPGGWCIIMNGESLTKPRVILDCQCYEN